MPPDIRPVLPPERPGLPLEQQPQLVVVTQAVPWWKRLLTTPKFLIIGGITVVVLVAGGITLAMMKSGTGKPSPSVAQSAANDNSQSTTHSSDKNTAPSTPSATPDTTDKNKPSGTAQAPNASGSQGGSGSTGTGGAQSGGSSGTLGCTAGQVGTPPNCYPAPPAPVAGGKQWKLAWNEEFGGSDYDHSKLSPCFDWNFGGCTASFNNGRELYAASQVQVSGGTAKLVAQPQSPPISDGACQGGSCTYLSGLLSTARPRADNGSDYLYTFTYGYVEASLKLPATQGFFTAFWMLPADPSFSYHTEIDILENLGYDNKTMFMTYHYNDRGQSYTPNTGVNNNGACPVTDLSGGFHKFGMDWQPTHVAWYIDGVKCGQFDGDSTTIENGPMQLILDMMVDNNWQRSWNEGLLDSSLVRQLEGTTYVFTSSNKLSVHKVAYSCSLSVRECQELQGYNDWPAL